MESTLFTTLTPNEEANLSGGTYNKASFSVKLFKLAIATNKVTQTATGGKGGNGGPITVGGGKKSPVVIVDSELNSSGGKGGDAFNSSDNAVGAG